ncbi:MAG: hypothetical protein R3350_09905, partial [Saprospiraceae bacterium]|nr:hypothetical protein [Saprospiraceae bacterium]
MIDRKTMRRLAEAEGEYCISLYLPLSPGEEKNSRRLDPLKTKGLLAATREKLQDKGLDSDTAELLTKKLNLKLEGIEYRDISPAGLGVFHAEDLLEVVELPVTPDELAYVGKNFYLRPVLPLLNSDGRFFVLTLEEQKAMLFEATRECIYPVTTDQLVLETGNEDRSAGNISPLLPDETGLQNIHDIDIEDSSEKEELYLRKYLRLLDENLREILGNGEKAPLIVSASDFVFSVFSSISRYPNILEKRLPPT